MSQSQHYRYWILWRCPSVRFLDYSKIKDAERQRAVELFGTADAPTPLASKVRLSLRTFAPQTFACLYMTDVTAQQISNVKSRTFTVPDSISSMTTKDGAEPATTDRVGRVKLTPAERKRVEQLIRDAKSLADITRLERELNEGRVPGGVVG